MSGTRRRPVAPVPEPLREVPRVRQDDSGVTRRWWACPTMDLYVWDTGEGIQRFELTYGKPADEHSLIWDAGKGRRHLRIDDGEATPWRNDSPIAVPDGTMDVDRIALDFEAAAAGMEARVYRFVLGRLYAV